MEEEVEEVVEFSVSKRRTLEEASDAVEDALDGLDFLHVRNNTFM